MAEDLGKKFVRINAAKKAAAELRELLSKCKTSFLRDEGELLVNEAGDVIRQMEAKAIDPNCNLLDETIGKAALKAEDSLRVLAGKIAAADRQVKPGNILGKIGRQFSNPHKQMFKDSRDCLRLVLPSMTEVAGAGLTDSEDEEEEAQQQQQQLQSSQDSSSSELHLTYQKGNVKVCSVALTPGPDGNTARSTLWVGLTKKVEFCVECNPSKRTEVALPDKGQAVTCAVFDSLGGVWTGHADGVVRLHLRGMWGAAQHPTNVGLPVRSMAIDSRGHCWVGDEAGIIRVLVLDPNNGRLSCRIQLYPPQAQGWLRLAELQGPAAAAAAFGASTSSSGGGGGTLARLGSGGGSSGGLAKATPVSAMFSKGLAVFSSGGEWPYNITVWHSQNYQKLEVSNCESFGTTRSFALLPWEAPPEVPAGAPAGQEDSSRAVPGVPATGIALGYATDQPRATVPARIMAASMAKQAAAGSSTARAADTSDYSSWRLLSGHDRGQVLLWQFNGVTRTPGTSKLLQLLAVIGEARPQCGVRGMAVFEDLSMLALVHANGDLTALPMPKANNGAVPASSSRPPFSAVGVPASRPAAAASGSGVMFGASSLHCWKPRVAHIKAHKNPIVATSSLGDLLVTATSSTVKGWTAERLKLEAQGDGLMFSRRNRSHSSLSTSAALAAAIKAADNSAEFAFTAPGKLEAIDRGAAAAAAVAAAAEPGATAAWLTDDDDVVADVLPKQLRSGGSADGGAKQTDEAGATSLRLPASARTISAPVEMIGAALHDCKAPNPMSRENASRRGLQLDPNGTVVIKPRAEPRTVFNVFPVSPLQVPSYPVISPVAGVEYAPGQVVSPMAASEVRHPLQSTPPGAGSLPQSDSNGGLELTPSINPNIREGDVIVNCELVLKEVIGSGAEGKVYRGTWTNIDIAAKEYLAVDDEDDGQTFQSSTTPSDVGMQNARRALGKEVNLLTQLNHPNLVRFCGVCLDPPLVVMEYYKHGSIYSLLEKARKQWVSNQAKPIAQSQRSAKHMNYLTWDRRLEMLHDVAAGMMYLHKRLYVHGDLRSPNLFVGQDGRVKIGDFGFTKRLNGKQSSTKVKRITHPRWVAPELLGESRLSTASDVYSYGIIMFEMLTWLLPFSDRSKEQVVFFVLNGGRPQIPADDQLPPLTSSSTCLGNYKKLMQECWDQDPTKRPSFDKIAARLKAMIRWRLVIRQNKVLSDVARKLRTAKQSRAEAEAIPTPPPAAAAAPPVTAAEPGGVMLGTTAGHHTAAASPSSSKAALLQPAAVAAAATPAATLLPPAATAAAAMTAEPVSVSAASHGVHEEDHEPLPVPDHPIVTVPDHAANPTEVPAAEMLIMSVGRSSSATGATVLQGTQQVAAGEVVLGEAAVQDAAAAQQQQHDGDSPFAVIAQGPSQALPPQVLMQRLSSGRSGDVLVIGPEGQQIIVGSDLPESPCSLSTGTSYDVTGLSATTSVLAPGQDGGVRGSGVYDLQGSASADMGRTPYPVPGQPPPLSVKLSSATAVASLAEQPDSPPPPGYPVPNKGASSAVNQAASSTARAAGVLDVVSAEGEDSSPLLPPGSVSARLDPIQESSEGLSGTACSSKGFDSRTVDAVGSQAADSLDTALPWAEDIAAGTPSRAAAPLASAPAGPASSGALPELQISGMAGIAAASVGQQQQSGRQQRVFHALSSGELLRLGSNGLHEPECKVTPWLQQQPSQPALASEGSQQSHTSAATPSNDSSTEGCQHLKQQQQQAVFSRGDTCGVLGSDLLAMDDTFSNLLQTSAFAHLAAQTSQQQQQRQLVQEPSEAADTPDTAAEAAAACTVAAAVVDSMPADAAVGLQASERQQQHPDYFTAADSPFFQTFGTADVSGSIDMAEVFGQAAAGAAGVAPASGASFGGFQAHRYAADYLDDSRLPLSDDGPKLGEAVTVVYPEGQAVVDAAIRSSCTVKVGSSVGGSSHTMPSLEEGVVAVDAGSSPGQGPPAEVRGPSFTAVEQSPFAAHDLCDDPCEPLEMEELHQAPGTHAAATSTGASPFAAAGQPAAAPRKDAGAPAAAVAPAAASGPAGHQGPAGVAAAGAYPGGMFSAGMFPGPFMQGGGVSVGPAPLPVPGLARQAPAGLMVGSPGQQVQQPQLAQHQRASAYQPDPTPGWLPSMLQPHMMGFNAAALGPFHMPQLRPVYPGAALPYGSQLPGTTSSASTLADVVAPSRALSGVSDGALASGMTLGSLALPGSPGPAATSITAAADDDADAGVMYKKPLGDDVLYKRLGQSDGDVPEQAKRTLETWQKTTMKPRRPSGTGGDAALTTRQQQHQDAAGDLARVSTASDMTARTASPAAPTASSPMTPGPAAPALLAQLMANPGLAAALGGAYGYPALDPSVLSAMLLGPPVNASASGVVAAKVSAPGFSQVQPGEKVKVVNTSTTSYAGPMDSLYTAQQHQYLQQQSPPAAANAVLQGWLGASHQGGTLVTHPQQLKPMSPAAATAAQQQQQQYEMMVALQHLQQQMARGPGPQGLITAPAHHAADPAAAAAAAGGNVTMGSDVAGSILDNWSHAVAGSGEAPAVPQPLQDASAPQQQHQQQQSVQQLQQQAHMQHVYQYYAQQQQLLQQQQHLVNQQPLVHQPQPQQAATLPAVHQGAAPAQQQAARLQRMPAQRR